MSAEILSTISGALAQTFAPELSRQWNRRAIFLQNIRITSGMGAGGGQNVGWDVEFSTSGSSAETFTDGAAMTNYSQDPVTKATLDWGKYRSAFSLSNLEINAAAANVSNATALEDMVGERFLGAIASITDKMETDVFSGTAAPALIGLDTALDTTTSYGGVAPGTYSEWTGNVSANGGSARALTLDLLASAEQLAFQTSGMEPDFLVTTAAVKSKYEGLFNAAFRTVNDGMGPVRQYNASTSDLFWRGKPVIRSRKATAGCLYMVNSDELELVVLPWANVPDGIMAVNRSAISSNGKDVETVNIPFKCYPKGRVGSSVEFIVEVYAQLKVKRRNAHVRVADISES